MKPHGSLISAGLLVADIHYVAGARQRGLEPLVNDGKLTTRADLLATKPAMIGSAIDRRRYLSNGSSR